MKKVLLGEPLRKSSSLRGQKKIVHLLLDATRSERVHGTATATMLLAPE
jgi:hypothetical protein